jgi:hypothetical protein
LAEPEIPVLGIVKLELNVAVPQVFVKQYESIEPVNFSLYLKFDSLMTRGIELPKAN